MSIPHVDEDDDEESSLRMGKRGDEMSVPHVAAASLRRVGGGLGSNIGRMGNG